MCILKNKASEIHVCKHVRPTLRSDNVKEINAQITTTKAGKMFILRFGMGFKIKSARGTTLQKLEKKFEHPGCIQVYLLVRVCDIARTPKRNHNLNHNHNHISSTY
jgi:hypothetical protein